MKSPLRFFALSALLIFYLGAAAARAQQAHYVGFANPGGLAPLETFEVSAKSAKPGAALAAGAVHAGSPAIAAGLDFELDLVFGASADPRGTSFNMHFDSRKVRPLSIAKVVSGGGIIQPEAEFFHAYIVDAAAPPADAKGRSDKLWSATWLGDKGWPAAAGARKNSRVRLLRMKLRWLDGAIGGSALYFTKGSVGAAVSLKGDALVIRKPR